MVGCRDGEEKGPGGIGGLVRLGFVVFSFSVFVLKPFEFKIFSVFNLKQWCERDL
jgi:hypothetical protein